MATRKRTSRLVSKNDAAQREAAPKQAEMAESNQFSLSARLEELKTNAKELQYMKGTLLSSVDKVLTKKQDAFPLRPSSALKPLRDLYYDLCNYYKPGSIPQDTLEPRVRMLFDLGYVIEENLKKYFKPEYHVCYEQHEVEVGELFDGTKIKGSIDWAVRNDQELIIMDSKSSADFTFKTAPKEDNIAQMQLYLHSKWARENNINRAVLVYYNKNNSDLACYEVPYDANVAIAILDRFNVALSAYMHKAIPAREFVLGCDWKADYSSYKTYEAAEFKKKLSERNRVMGTGHSNTTKDFLKKHVLTFGADVVEYENGAFAAVYDEEKRKLNLITIGGK